MHRAPLSGALAGSAGIEAACRFPRRHAGDPLGVLSSIVTSGTFFGAPVGANRPGASLGASRQGGGSPSETARCRPGWEYRNAAVGRGGAQLNRQRVCGNQNGNLSAPKRPLNRNSRSRQTCTSDRSHRSRRRWQVGRPVRRGFSLLRRGCRRKGQRDAGGERRQNPVHRFRRRRERRSGNELPGLQPKGAVPQTCALNRAT